MYCSSTILVVLYSSCWKKHYTLICISEYFRKYYTLCDSHSSPSTIPSITLSNVYIEKEKYVLYCRDVTSSYFDRFPS